MKCVKYWPEKGNTVTKGDLTITTTAEDEWTEYTIRQLRVTKVSGRLMSQSEV
mgnify:FL=1